MEPQYLTETELAARWSKARVTVSRLQNWRLSKNPKGPAWIRIGKGVVYTLEAVDRYEREHTVTPEK